MTDPEAPSGIWRWLMIAAAAAALAGCDNDPVDRELVGTWQAAVSLPAGAVQLKFTTLSNGQYLIEFVGPVAVPVETGYFSAGDGEWRKEKITGGIEEGTYEFVSDDSVLFTGAAVGPVVWTRVADAAPAAVSTAPPPVVTDAAAALPSVAPVAADAVAPDILSAGPFGPATAPASPGGFGQPNAAPAAPFGAPTGGLPVAPFGAPDGGVPVAAPFTAPAATATPATSALPATNGPPVAPAPFGAPTGFGAPAASSAPLFAPPPEIVVAPPLPNPSPFGNAAGSAGATPFGGAAPSLNAVPAQAAQNAIAAGTNAVTNLDGAALADLPRQTLNDLEASTREAAAGVIDQAAADAAAEAERKVGERIQGVATNVGSRVRNFFKRDRQKNEQEAEEQ
jgi:hypothetical protein